MLPCKVKITDRRGATACRSWRQAVVTAPLALTPPARPNSPLSLGAVWSCRFYLPAGHLSLLCSGSPLAPAEKHAGFV